MPLTMDRAKPAVPFGGTYRLIDFVLSNLANAGMRQIAVLTQYKSHSLDQHISLTWRMSTMLGNYVTPVPAQQRLGPRWYQGSADAIFQSMNLIVDEDPDYVVVFGADNIYRMDVEQMLDAHIDGGLGCTVAGIRVPRSQATAFGVIDAGGGQQDQGVPGEAGRPARSAGRSRGVVRLDGQLHLHHRRADRGAVHATPRTTTPGTTWAATSSRASSSRGEGQVYDFTANEVPGLNRPRQGLLARRGDDRRLPRGPHGSRLGRPGVQPLQQRLADLDLPGADAGRQVHPARASPWTRSSAPAASSPAARSRVRCSRPTSGCTRAPRSTNSVILSDVMIGRTPIVHRAILDKNVVVPDGAQVGVDPEADQARGYTISDGGITVVGKGVTVSPT